MTAAERMLEWLENPQHYWASGQTQIAATRLRGFMAEEAAQARALPAEIAALIERAKAEHEPEWHGEPEDWKRAWEREPLLIAATEQLQRIIANVPANFDGSRLLS